MRSKFLFAAVCASLVACGDDTDSKCATGADCGSGNGGGDVDSGQDESEVASGATCPDNSTLTYDNFGKEFFQSYCLGCHSEELSGAARGGAPADHNFDTAELIRELAAHIDETAAAGPDAVNTAMPPGGDKPSEEERKKLGEWLACDAP